MNWLKPYILHLYYQLHQPRRRAARARREARGQAPIVILCYHRVADDEATPWTQTNQSFQEQISWLQDNFELISLAETQRRLRAGWNERDAVSITFDDGYSANCDAALPLLVREGIPCTYFVSTRNVLDNRPFAHDLRLGKLLATNTLAELQSMADAGIEIGAHTDTHADLGNVINEEQLYQEVVVSGQELVEALGHKMRYFAFPFGLYHNLNANAFALGKQCGYQAMCSAYGGFNFPGDDAFHLQRIMVDQSTIRLKNWATLDPRKLRMVRRYEYDRQPERAPLLAGVGRA
jgi:peptidoglycan/xylan/chitin deacetylase (PgdA/CDA1 family)